MDFIDIRLKDFLGGFLIPNDEDGRMAADELLKNPKYQELPSDFLPHTNGESLIFKDIENA